jgi:uncharacterized membrane protein
MTTPIVMLVLMLAPYVLIRLLSVATQRDFDLRQAASVGLTLLFLFTGAGHFIETGPMSQMLPPWIPARVPLIYLTGILEFAIATGFLFGKFRYITGWVAIAVLILFFPGNIYAAINHVPMGGHAWGPVYLIIRAPLQAVIVFWVYWFTIRQPGNMLSKHDVHSALPLQVGDHSGSLQ